MADQISQQTETNIRKLEGREAVRMRPGMYVGGTDVRALHHLIYEVVDNSIDEAMADFATEVTVTVNADGSLVVEDNGRGIPVERHEQLSEETGREVSTLEGVMTVLKFGGKFEKGVYQTSGGLHGVGVTVVNFLSEWCEVEVYRDGHVYQQEYERGIPQGPVRRMGATKSALSISGLVTRSPPSTRVPCSFRVVQPRTLVEVLVATSTSLPVRPLAGQTERRTS